jgi:hypothetical protein
MTEPPEPTYRCLTDSYEPLGRAHYIAVRGEMLTPLTHFPRAHRCKQGSRPHPARYGCLAHGYHGSAVADLARAILHDYLALGPLMPHGALVTAFATTYLAQAPFGRSWALGGGLVRQWLTAWEGDELPWVEARPPIRSIWPFLRADRQATTDALTVERRLRARFGVVIPRGGGG